MFFLLLYFFSVIKATFDCSLCAMPCSKSFPLSLFNHWSEGTIISLICQLSMRSLPGKMKKCGSSDTPDLNGRWLGRVTLQECCSQVTVTLWDISCCILGPVLFHIINEDLEKEWH